LAIAGETSPPEPGFFRFIAGSAPETESFIYSTFLAMGQENPVVE
jgi:hypothetical protein